MVFAGDFSQLEPAGPGRQSIYNVAPSMSFQGALNSYIELNGMHRFKHDREWGLILKRFREGIVTADDIDTINHHCLARHCAVPRGIQTACHANKQRNAINSHIFYKYCEENTSERNVVQDAAIIFMDDLEMKDKADGAFKFVTSNAVRRHFYEHCGDGSMKCGGNRSGAVESALKLYYDAPVLLTNNTNVSGGEANGSRLRLKGIKKKVGENPRYVKIDNDALIPAFSANQIESLLVEHEAKHIIPSIFELKVAKYSFVASFPDPIGNDLKVSMRGTQFPIVSNSATTGHKLQGCSVDNIFVNDWHYGANWVYVVLSRVRTMNGLYMREPLSRDLRKYALKPEMAEMIDTFRQKLLLPSLSPEVYSRIKNWCPNIP
jgi:hypothetical protein